MKMKKLTIFALAAAFTIGTFGFSFPVKAAENSTDYTITIPATLTVEQKGWNATDGIKAQVKSGDTFDLGKKLTVTAKSTNSWALKSGANTIGYNLATTTGTYSSSATPASWEFSATDLNADGGKTNPMGIIVEDYSSKPAGEYKDTVTFTAKVEDAVKVETLLTTLTFGGSSTYSETTSGVVSVTATNVTDYDAKFGWLWYDEGSLSVTAKEGYTITKCVFRQNNKRPITDTEAPFEIHSSDEGRITEDVYRRMDGVTSIEVYGYEN